VEVRPIGHEAAGVDDKLALIINRRQTMLGRQLDEASPVHVEEG